jgi:hypothetical protein
MFNAKSKELEQLRQSQTDVQNGCEALGVWHLGKEELMRCETDEADEAGNILRSRGHVQHTPTTEQ